MSKLKAAILGYGKMGRVYGRWFSENGSCTVTDVYNHTDSKKELAANNLPDAKYYTDWEKLLTESECDIVGITSASNERLAQIKMAIETGRHIICEKPVCMDLDELKAIQSMMEGRKTKFLVASELRLHPVIVKAQELLPRVGKIFHIDIHYSMLRDEIKWKHLMQSGGGILRELGQHLIDVTNIWLGKPERVYGHNKLILPGREVEDFTETVIEYEGGATVSVQCHYFEHTANSYNMRIYGTNGQMDLRCSSYDVHDCFVRLYDGEGLTEAEIELPADIDAVYPGHMDSFKKEIDGFISAILDDVRVKNTLENESVTMQIIDASYESTRQKQVVNLPLKGFSAGSLNECFVKI